MQASLPVDAPNLKYLKCNEEQQDDHNEAFAQAIRGP